LFTRLLVPRPIFDAILAHARTELPNECCGLLAGVIADDVGWVSEHFPIRNDRASPTEYESNPQDMLSAVRAMRAAGTEVLAIYHSHPTSAPVPSRTDLARNFWGETAAHVIIGMSGSDPEVRAWWLTETEYRPAELGVGATPGSEPS
ncbi:MAG TPA: M67 family metallopeptidase, partial [Gemmataceae bacterium]|nr:M67 family metallopeptidase [Gemmataceae bacterium]